MATKSRHLKTAMQLWVADNRKAGYTSADLAEWTGVTEDTARGWESRGRPSEDAIRILERKFGKAAPDGEDANLGDQSSLVSAIRELVEEMRLARLEQARWTEAVQEALVQALNARTNGAPTDGPASRPHEGAPR